MSTFGVLVLIWVGADNATDLADNTLDLMVGRELKGNDFLSVGEMRDELYLCESSRSLVTG